MTRAVVFLESLRRELAQHMLTENRQASIDAALSHVIERAYEAGRTGCLPDGKPLEDTDLSKDLKADAARFRQYFSSRLMRERLRQPILCLFDLPEWRVQIDKVAAELSKELGDPNGG